MGACNIEFDIPGTASEAAVRQAFLQQKAADEGQNGHQKGYSGDFQTVNEVKIHDKLFLTYGEAHAYCLDKAEKWGYVVAVRYKDNVVVKHSKKVSTLADKIALLREDVNKREKELAFAAGCIVADTKGLVPCSHCKAKLPKKIESFTLGTECPICRSSFAPKAMRSAQAKQMGRLGAVIAQYRQLKAQEYAAAAAKNNTSRWLIAGWGAC